jgi:hypothetical protein
MLQLEYDSCVQHMLAVLFWEMVETLGGGPYWRRYVSGGMIWRLYLALVPSSLSLLPVYIKVKKICHMTLSPWYSALPLAQNQQNQGHWNETSETVKQNESYISNIVSGRYLVTDRMKLIQWIC